MALLYIGSTSGKATDFTLPRTSSGQARWPYEMVQIGTILSLVRVEENPKGKTTRHWLWRVKDIPHVAQSQSRSQTVAVRGERVTTAPPSLNSVLGK